RTADRDPPWRMPGTTRRACAPRDPRRRPRTGARAPGSSYECSRGDGDGRESARPAALVTLANLSGDFGAGAEKARLDCPVGQLERPPDLLVSEPIEIPQDQDLGQILRNLRECGKEHLGPLPADRIGGRVVAGGQHRRHRVVGDEAEGLLALAAPVAVDAEVAGEGGDPGDQRKAAVIAVQVLEDL